jgi:hypothetical protein
MFQLPDPLRITERLSERAQSPRLSFESLTVIERLDAIEIACRNPRYCSARSEALPESDEYSEWLAALTDSCIGDAEIGRRAREIVAKYLQACAQQRGEDLAEFAR